MCRLQRRTQGRPGRARYHIPDDGTCYREQGFQLAAFCCIVLRFSYHTHFFLLLRSVLHWLGRMNMHKLCGSMQKGKDNMILGISCGWSFMNFYWCLSLKGRMNTSVVCSQLGQPTHCDLTYFVVCRLNCIYYIKSVWNAENIHIYIIKY